MRRIIRFAKSCISIVVIFVMLSGSATAYMEGSESYYFADTTISSGVIIPKEDVNAAFAGEIEYDTLSGGFNLEHWGR